MFLMLIFLELKVFFCWVEKKESVKVNAGKKDNINPVVITGFAINGNKIISVDMPWVC